MKMNATKFALSFEMFEIKIAFQIKHELEIIFTIHFCYCSFHRS
jgi:hypothetical protein